MVLKPSAAIVLFSLWDFGEDSSHENSEDFIAAAAVPISCLQEGYRSIALFDSNHMRCGSHAYSCLLTKETSDKTPDTMVGGHDGVGNAFVRSGGVRCGSGLFGLRGKQTVCSSTNLPHHPQLTSWIDATSRSVEVNIVCSSTTTCVLEHNPTDIYVEWTIV